MDEATGLACSGGGDGIDLECRGQLGRDFGSDQEVLASRMCHTQTTCCITFFMIVCHHTDWEYPRGFDCDCTPECIGEKCLDGFEDHL